MSFFSFYKFFFLNKNKIYNPFSNSPSCEETCSLRIFMSAMFYFVLSFCDTICVYTYNYIEKIPIGTREWGVFFLFTGCELWNFLVVYRTANYVCCGGDFGLYWGNADRLWDRCCGSKVGFNINTCVEQCVKVLQARREDGHQCVKNYLNNNLKIWILNNLLLCFWDTNLTSTMVLLTASTNICIVIRQVYVIMCGIESLLI